MITIPESLLPTGAATQGSHVSSSPPAISKGGGEGKQPPEGLCRHSSSLRNRIRLFQPPRFLEIRMNFVHAKSLNNIFLLGKLEIDEQLLV